MESVGQVGGTSGRTTRYDHGYSPREYEAKFSVRPELYIPSDVEKEVRQMDTPSSGSSE